jgi:hypothetical protein
MAVLFVFGSMEAFSLLLCVCKKDYARVRCGCLRASLRVVRDLFDVVGLRHIGLCATLWTDDMVLSFYFWSVKNEPSVVRQSLLSFRFGDNAFCFW